MKNIRNSNSSSMKIALWTLLLLVPGSAEKFVDQRIPPVDHKLPACEYMGVDFGNIPKYHLDAACNRRAHNSHERRAIRAARYNVLLQTGVQHIPDEQTAHCPLEVENWEMKEHGHDTKLLIENEASTPIVLIWVFRGVEYSAMNPTITPPHHDLEAILKPGQWASIEAFEGNVYYAREITKDGGLGNILMMHRPGLVGFTNKLDQELSCEKPKLPLAEDLEQLTPKNQEEIVKEALEKVDGQPRMTVPVVGRKIHEVTKIDPNWDRSHPHMEERCHILYKGFRNTLEGCALHVFYVGMQEPPTTGPMQCREEFKFHLGLHPSPEDYMHSWESRSKFEATFVGHTWVARLASNMDIVVDTYTVQPIVVRDCPARMKQIMVGTGAEVNGIGEINAIQANLTLGVMSNVIATAQANVHSV